jgi:4-amino-4-deoxy-L-arabinose transferase-like glycosyltransferase
MKVKYSSSGADRQVLLSAVLAAIALLAIAGIVPPVWLLLQHIRSLLWGVVLLATGFLQGWILCRPLLPDHADRDPGYITVLSAGLGLGALSLELLLLGLAGFYTRPAITALVLVILALSFGAIRYLKLDWPEVDLKWQPEATLPLCLTGLAVFMNLYLALVPPVFFDAMSYHLELPSRYLQAERVFHVSENLYTGYPQLVEILYGAGLALGGVGVAGVISLIGFILVLALVWTWGRRAFDDESAAWATAVLSFTPPLTLLVGFYHNDWYLSFFTLAVVTLLPRRERNNGIIVFAGCAAGLAAGTKYTGLAFALAVPLLAGVAMDLLQDRRLRAGSWSVFLLTAILVASPWYLKNLVFTADPLYPLLSGLQGDVTGLADLARDTHFRSLRPDDLWSWALIPYYAVFRPSEVQLSMSLGVLPLALAPTLLSLRKKRLVSPFLLTWMLGSLAVWYATFRAGRFALPMLVIFLVWLSAGFREAVRNAPGKGAVLTVTVVFLLFVNLAHVFGFLSVYADVLKGAFSKISSDAYLYHTYAPYRAISLLNRLSPESKVLFLGEMRGFYSEFPREIATFEVPNRLLEMVRTGKTADETADALLSKGFIFLLYNHDEMERLAEKTPQLRLDPSERARLDTFLRDRAIKIFDDNGISVWKMRRE